MRVKLFIKKNYFIREITRAFRSYFGQPKWKNIINKSYVEIVERKVEPNILIATGGGSYLAGVYIESMLGAALTLRGNRVHVLLCDGILPACFQSDIDWDRNEKKFSENGPSKIYCKSCFSPSSRMYESLGFQVHRLSGMINEAEKFKIKELINSIQVRDIRNFVYDDLPVGEHAYAGALRFYAKAELNDTYSENVLRRYLEAAILSSIAVKRLCSIYNFDRAVLHHGIYVPQGVFAESFDKFKIPFVTWHVAYRKETFMFSHGGTYHRTLMSELTSSWENIDWSKKLNDKIINYLNSRWFGSKDWIHFHKNSVFDKDYMYSNLGLDKNKPYILALTNVMWDAQLHYPNNAFSGMLEWIVYTIEWFIKRPDLQLVLRVHPAELNGTLPSRQLVVDEIRKKFAELPNNIFLVGPENTISTYILAEDCNSAIIYGTKTGVELAANGIPVIVAGEAWIRGKGVTIDISTPREYDDTLSKLPFKSKMTDEKITRARKYAYHFFFRRMIPLSFVKSTKNNFNPFEFKIESIFDIASGKDKGLDVICNGIIYGTPFIYENEIN